MSLTFLAKSLRVLVEDVLRRPGALEAQAGGLRARHHRRGHGAGGADRGGGFLEEAATRRRGWLSCRSWLSPLRMRLAPRARSHAELEARVPRHHAPALPMAQVGEPRRDNRRHRCDSPRAPLPSAARATPIPPIEFPESLPVSARRDDIAAALRGASGDRRLRRDRLGQDDPAAEDRAGDGPGPRPRRRPDRPHPAAPDRRLERRPADRRGAEDAARRGRRLQGPVPGPALGRRQRQADDRRHPARRDARATRCCAPTTRSSSTRRTSAASTSTSCSATCARSCRAGPT